MHGLPRQLLRLLRAGKYELQLLQTGILPRRDHLLGLFKPMCQLLRCDCLLDLHRHPLPGGLGLPAMRSALYLVLLRWKRAVLGLLSRILS